MAVWIYTLYHERGGEISNNTSTSDGGGVVVNGDKSAFTITPEFDYYLGAFTFWTSVEFGNLGGDEDVSITPAIGVKYSF